MKNKLWVAVVIMSLLTLFGNAARAQSATGSSDPMYENTKSVSAALSINSAKAQCEGRTQGLSGDTKTKLALTLQKRVPGESWKPVVTWNSQGTGKSLVTIQESYPIHKGYDYRVKAVSRIVNSEGTILETVTKYSSIKSYR